MTTEIEKSPNRLIEITLDQKSLGQANPNIEHEREVAIFDILDGNTFVVDSMDAGPYRLHLSIADDRLHLTVRDEHSEPVATQQLPLTPLKRVMKDYFLVCDAYYDAVRTQPPAKIQAIDLNRRTLHDEGSKIFAEKLAGKVTVDADTARRLFTLLCALHWKG